ncbi:MAG: hypothetical protein ACLPIC_00265 [Rhodoblastus sp.]|uniref:hypothetical protein n=1 Tax=Rhodoblastus sp. TaxID=1962975 RepID=UPI003F94EA73
MRSSSKIGFLLVRRIVGRPPVESPHSSRNTPPSMAADWAESIEGLAAPGDIRQARAKMPARLFLLAQAVLGGCLDISPMSTP